LLEAHFVKHVAVDHGNIFGKPAGDSYWVRIRTLNAEAGLHENARDLFPVITYLGLSTPARHRMRVPRSDMAEILELHQDRLPLEEAAFVLGTTSNTVRQLVEIGAIRLVSGSHPYLVRRTDVARLLDSILSNVGVQYFIRRPKSAIGLRGAAKRTGQSIGTILGALANGLIKSIGRLLHAEGFDALLFDQSEVMSALLAGGGD
jgi:hypothetical protein